MSANIPVNMRLDDLLKATGYNCPVELQGKTFDEATSGGSSSLEDNKEVEITENGTVEITPSEGYDGMKKVTATVNVAGGSIDVFAKNIPAVYITDQEEMPDPPDRSYICVAVTENGSFVDLEHLNEAKFLCYIENGGSSSLFYTTGEPGTMFGDYYCVPNQDFTVTNGKITLGGTEYNIFGGIQISIADMLYGAGA